MAVVFINFPKSRDSKNNHWSTGTLTFLTLPTLAYGGAGQLVFVIFRNLHHTSALRLQTGNSVDHTFPAILCTQNCEICRGKGTVDLSLERVAS